MDAIRLQADDPAILTREGTEGIEVWREGEEAHTLYTPGDIRYGFWRMAAREQVKARAKEKANTSGQCLA